MRRHLDPRLEAVALEKPLRLVMHLAPVLIPNRHEERGAADGDTTMFAVLWLGLLRSRPLEFILELQDPGLQGDCVATIGFEGLNGLLKPHGNPPIHGVGWPVIHVRSLKRWRSLFGFLPRLLTGFPEGTVEPRTRYGELEVLIWCSVHLHKTD